MRRIFGKDQTGLKRSRLDVWKPLEWQPADNRNFIVVVLFVFVVVVVVFSEWYYTQNM
ncbi:Uncharacterized protein APZ42_023737 [Daphnia magna]|uniref:Uncharacterized protein n=1 Tax=Daphnia magna TaxID=35525 RepID=A0A164UQT9_9CRUS|nr:Uncharacterized protein APZ42_023737 [Daphnia magna]